MFCKNCGNQLKSGDMFCPRCGMRVEGQEQQRRQNAYFEEEPRGNNGILYTIIGALAALIISVLVFGGYYLTKEKNDYADTVQTAAKADEKAADSKKESVDMVAATSTPEATATPVPTATAVPVPTVIATTVPTVVPAAPVVTTSNYYIFPDSSGSYLSRAQVDSLTLYEMYLARNEIYARHGRIFKNSDLREYFGNQAWYVPMYSAETFDEGVFNAYEKENIKLIKSVEQSYGSPYL